MSFIIKYRLPTAQLVDGLFGKLKGVTKGYATLNYEDTGSKRSSLVKLHLAPVAQRSDCSHVTPKLYICQLRSTISACWQPMLQHAIVRYPQAYVHAPPCCWPAGCGRGEALLVHVFRPRHRLFMQDGNWPERHGVRTTCGVARPALSNLESCILTHQSLSYGTTNLRVVLRAAATRSRSPFRLPAGPVPSIGFPKLPTPFDMLQQIAMYQEIFSAPSEGSSKPVWKRRCVLLWTFSDIRDRAERVRGKQPKKETMETAGTTWRFLSKLDPTSQYHQQRAYLPGSPNVPSIITPNVGSQHHLGAVMHTNSGGFYDVANLAPPYQLQETNIHPNDLNMLGGIANGLTAPLPTSYLHSSYGQSCGSSIIENDDSLKPQNSYTSDGPTGDTAAVLISDSLQGLVASQLAMRMLMSVHGRKRVCVLGLGHYVFAWQRVMVEMGPGMEEERETGAKVYLGLTVIVATLPPREEHRPTTMVGEKRKRTPDDSSESLAPGDEGYVELDLDLDHFKRARRERGYSQSTTRRHRGFRPELYWWIPRRALNAGY
ncbi:hypothetical protein PG985_005829 [Apiospora marii]|uniref:uncharacterized protein n=1 Tax=Apiospora marii TaxID=335849 RepID=UPI0031307DBD